jgi:enoyl-CoA hydratase/carnithine racemase
VEERLSDEVLSEVRGHVATLTLNRPASLNALSFGMLQEIAARLDAWERDERVHTIVLRGAGGKAFCAGGDVRALREGFIAGSRLHHEYFAFEYALDYRIHTYPKTIVALIDGIVMGGGMGISQGAALRIVGSRTRMAMPETAIGLFPDVGGSWFLSRTPGNLGIYLGLAGPTIGAADAIYCGLADLDVSSEPGEPELARLRPAIDLHFGAATVEAIVASLESERRPEFRAWAERTLAALAQRSPTMLAVTLEQLRRGAGLSLAECFRMELNLIHGCFDQGDFVEGIRAVLVEKDNRPRWSPASLAEVTREAVDRFFAPRWIPARHPLATIA